MSRAHQKNKLEGNTSPMSKSFHQNTPDSQTKIIDLYNLIIFIYFCFIPQDRPQKSIFTQLLNLVFFNKTIKQSGSTEQSKNNQQKS